MDVQEILLNEYERRVQRAIGFLGSMLKNSCGDNVDLYQQIQEVIAVLEDKK